VWYVLVWYVLVWYVLVWYVLVWYVLRPARPSLFWHFHKVFLIEIGHHTSDFAKSDMSDIRSDV